MKEKTEKELLADKKLPFYLRYAKFEGGSAPNKYIKSRSYGTDMYLSKNLHKPILLKSESI